MSRRIHDLTLPLRPGMPVWPGDPCVGLVPVLSIEAHGVSVSRLSLGTHSGTHVDAPAHLLADGATVERLALSVLLGPATVVHLPSRRHVSAADLADLDLPPGCQRLLLKTSNSDRGLLQGQRFASDYVALQPDAAEWLVRRGLLLVGIDALSVDPHAAEAGPAHWTLLSADIVIVEGLNLSGVPVGDYEFVCLPLPIAGGDGAPARAVLIGE